MVTSTVIQQSEVKIALPKAGAASSKSGKKGVTISLDSEGKIFFQKKEVELQNLESLLKSEIADSEAKSVVLAGDYEVNLGMAMKILDVAKKAGALKLGIATKESSQSSD